MIAKAIEGSITKTSLEKLRIHRGEYEWYDAGGIIRSDVTTITYLLLKSINSATNIGFSNLFFLWKATLAKSGNNVKDLLDDMS